MELWSVHHGGSVQGLDCRQVFVSKTTASLYMYIKCCRHFILELCCLHPGYWNLSAHLLQTTKVTPQNDYPNGNGHFLSHKALKFCRWFCQSKPDTIMEKIMVDPCLVLKFKAWDYLAFIQLSPVSFRCGQKGRDLELIFYPFISPNTPSICHGGCNNILRFASECTFT